MTNSVYLASCLLPLLGLAVTATGLGEDTKRAKPSEQPPRKLVVATVKSSLGGSKQDRVAGIDRLVRTAEEQAWQQYQRRGLDLIVLPETILQEAKGPKAQDQAIAIDDPAVVAVGEIAKRAGSYIVLPLVLKEADGATFSNAALLLDRSGKPAGTYRKAHPVALGGGVFENGVIPGTDYPVFNCDFGKLGIQICWDMCYEEGWRALAEAGAEIVALPSASPQTIRPAAYAQRFRYWVVIATPRDNASIYNPIGMVSARTESADVVVDRIDLSSAVVHWTETIDNGRTFARAFGDRGGFTWSTREDTGLFWSNDPSTPVAAMLRQIKVPDMDSEVARIGAEVSKATKGSAR